MAFTSQIRLGRWRSIAASVISRAERLKDLSDDELLKRSREIQWKARADVRPGRLLRDAFALVRESARRATGMEHYPEQIVGGIALFHGFVAEMQTGEGKTLTATLPAYLRALAGQGCHVVTVNDYLAERDAALMGPIYRRLGLSVGCVLPAMSPDEKREAYKCDITYGTAKEIGFDFLRDRLRGGDTNASPRRRLFEQDALSTERPVQRGLYFALVDEADSVLIDEARTPLIIGLSQPHDAAETHLLRWSKYALDEMLDAKTDFEYEPGRRSAWLTEAGRRKLVLLAKPTLLDSVAMERIYGSVENALLARFAFEQGRDYVISEGKVVIVDESTGRMMDGRKWQQGLHQAVEAKHGISLTAATEQAAQVTVQRFFRQYEHLAGMTGTAAEVAREFRRTYGLPFARIPTHKPCIRELLPTRVFATRQEKWQRVADDIERLVAGGRAVLVGTPSVESSNALSAVLKSRSIEHQVLNALFHKQESTIVELAGQTGKVTIATNMAGRGTDIILDDVVKQQGGLHVIATEMHSAARIDRQLVGRAARQGDPGSYQFLLSLDDELFRCRSLDERKRLAGKTRSNPNTEVPGDAVGEFQKTQRFLEKQHAKERKELLRRERRRAEMHEAMGLDLYLELTE